MSKFLNSTCMKIENCDNVEMVTMDFCDGSSENTDMSTDADDATVEKKPKIYDINQAIVYTTKLDQMKIFKANIIDMNVKTVIESIIKESKPNAQITEPNVFITRKRKSNIGLDPHNSYEYLSYHINAFNRKVARNTKISNSRLLAMCKPVRIVLHDIKHTSHMKGHPKICKTKEFSEGQNMNKPVAKSLDKPLPATNIKRKLKYTVIFHDNQRKEADMYSFVNRSYVREYARFYGDDFNDKVSTFRALAKVKPITHVQCCCWYGREKLITSSLTPQCQEVHRFMRKPHKCASDLCTCCCRNVKSISHHIPLPRPSLINTSSEKPSEKSAGFKTEMHKLLTLSNTSTCTLIPKSLNFIPWVTRGNIPIEEKKHFLHSTDILFEDEYYKIGTNGQIELFLKNTGKDSRHISNLMSTTVTKIEVNICCWYKREQFAVHLVKLGTLANTVNFIRNSHQCSITNCHCCCKPIDSEKIELKLFPIAARYTNDLFSEKLNMKITFPQILKNPTPSQSRNSKAFSFHLAFTKCLLEIQNTAMPPDEQITIKTQDKIMSVLNKISKFRFNVHKPLVKHKISANVNLINISKTELKILDRIFNVIESFAEDSNETDNNPESVENSVPMSQMAMTACQTKEIQSPIKPNPSTLYSQLSVVTELKTKRYIPSFRGYAAHYNLSDLRNMFEFSPYKDSSITKSYPSKFRFSTTNIPSSSDDDSQSEKVTRDLMNDNEATTSHTDVVSKIRIRSPSEISSSFSDNSSTNLL